MMHAVETIYFDTLQFVYHLALAILVGGAVVIGAAAAPGIFASVRSRGEAVAAATKLGLRELQIAEPVGKK